MENGRLHQLGFKSSKSTGFHVDPSLGKTEATRLIQDDRAEVLFAAMRLWG
jgi:hypothetical protein